MICLFSSLQEYSEHFLKQDMYIHCLGLGLGETMAPFCITEYSKDCSLASTKAIHATIATDMELNLKWSLSSRLTELLFQKVLIK